jgi:hypothetical protein
MTKATDQSTPNQSTPNREAASTPGSRTSNLQSNLSDSPTLRLPDPPTAQLSFAQKQQLCLEWLRNEFQVYQRQGGQDTLKVWLQAQILQAVQAEKLPYTVGTGLPKQTQPGSAAQNNSRPEPGVSGRRRTCSKRKSRAKEAFGACSMRSARVRILSASLPSWPSATPRRHWK